MPELSREKEIFERAVEMSSIDARSEFLRQACEGDVALWHRLLALLAANDAPSSFLPGRPGVPPATSGAAGGEGAGTVVGRYKLLEQIGEGGFGVVYMAEQFEPIRRRVALKIIKPGMDSQQVIGRFEAERQALAMMEHPSIAQVFDAGTTEQGRPFFVMELVRGIPITTFCAEQGLELEARLRLFIQVCGAVQHAHQKGIIHRDLKPSNILVTLHGEEPVAKVIDFGIAKATQQSLTDKTVFTSFQQFLGTPAYMSPEQAALSGLDVDTRSDIYSLGVLLYELIAGGPPFDTKELLSAGLDAMRRTILEKEPERPSTRRRRTAQGKAPAAGGPPADRALGRELDVIVLKALAKDRDRRYATANGLAADLQRYLNHEPVTAVAPTLGYHLGKLYRRNRPLVAAVAAVAAVLLVASVVSTGLAIRAHRAETAALAEAAAARATTEFIWKELLKQLTPWQHTNRTISLRDAFDLAAGRLETRLAGQPLAEASVRLVFGRAHLGLSELAAADTNLQRALEIYRQHKGPLDEQTSETLYQLGVVREFQLRPAEAEVYFAEVASIRAQTLGPHHRDSITVAAKVLLLRARQMPDGEAEPLLRDSLENLRRFVGTDHHMTWNTMNTLGLIWFRGGEFDRAFEIFQETQKLAAAADGAAGNGALTGLELMAATRARQGRLAEADRAFVELIALREQFNGANHGFTLATRLRYSDEVLAPQGRWPEAALMLRQLAPVIRAQRPTLEPALGQSLQTLLAAWRAKGGGPDFEAFERQARAYLPSVPTGPTHSTAASPE